MIWGPRTEFLKYGVCSAPNPGAAVSCGMQWRSEESQDYTIKSLGFFFSLLPWAIVRGLVWELRELSREYCYYVSL